MKACDEADHGDGRGGGANGHSIESLAGAKDEPTSDQIIDAIHTCLAKAHEPPAWPCGVDEDIVGELTRRVRELSRLGPQYVLEAAFASASELVMLALLRTQASFLREVGLHDRAKSGGSDAQRLSLPAGATDLLRVVDSLCHLVVKMGETYGKFRHVLTLQGASDGRKRKSGSPPSMDGRRGRDGGGANGTGAPGMHRR
jgi:hypothetical protein